MKLPLAWLREYLPTLPNATVLVERLPMHGLEVEAVIDRRGDFEKIVVGHVVGVRPHPNADKLRLADVVVAPNGRSQEIVCGAPNIAVGQKVPVALLGAKLPNGLTIESRPIRGIVSNGMVCAEDELGLGTDHRGIMVLDEHAPVGAPLSTILGFDDVVLDLAIPANRADLMSMAGLAREISAILDLPLKSSRVKLPVAARTSARPVAVTIAASHRSRCPVYTARLIRGTTVGPSPTWLQQRLGSVGLRSINAIVDITNYVMLDCGQPLHAFDAAKVHGPITVRPAKAGEKLRTLDGQDRTLSAADLVIADQRGPIALAGIMGGEATEISTTTTEIILESAIFDPVSIRRTARRFGLISEASKRFERGLPMSLPAAASARAAQLIVELGGGRIVPGLTTIGQTTVAAPRISFRPETISARLGQSIPTTVSKKILKRLGFTIAGTRTWSVTPPPWRLDVTIVEDLIDEVGRLHGYEDTPTLLPPTTQPPEPVSDTRALLDQLRDHLTRIGYTELVSHAYYGEDDAQHVGGEHIRVGNPLDTTQAVLRRSMVPTIRRSLVDSADAGEDARVFEIGRVFLSGTTAVERRQPWVMAFGTAHKPAHREPAAWTILGTVRSLERLLSMGPGTLKPIIGTLHYKGRDLAWAEIDIRSFLSARQPKRFVPPIDMPAIVRDQSVWIPEQLTFADLAEVVTKANIPLLHDLTAIDAIDDSGRLGLTLRVIFRASDRTITKDEADRGMEQLKRVLTDLHVAWR